MMHTARRRAPSPLDLSHKTALVSRFWSRGGGAVLRRGARRALLGSARHVGFGVALAGLVALWLGGFDSARGLSPPALTMLFALGVVTAARVVRRTRRLEIEVDGLPPPADFRLADLDLVAVVLTTTFVSLSLSGGLDSPGYPALLAVVAILVAFHAPLTGGVTVALALSLEAIEGSRTGMLADRAVDIGIHGVFIVGFALLYHGAIAGLVRRAREQVTEAVDAHLRDLHQRAREYRLIVSRDPPSDAEDDPEKWLTGAVGEVRAAVRAGLEVAHAAIGGHTVAVYLLGPDDRHLHLRECLSQSDQVDRGPLPSGEGLLGVVLRRRAAVRLCGKFRGASYYRGGVGPRAFLGVPLLEQAGDDRTFVRGVALVDRMQPEAFTERDEQLLSTIAREMLRAMQVERVMGYIRKDKDEQSRFYRAIEALNLLSKPAEICEAVTRLAGEIVPLDFVAVTLVEEGPDGERIHRVAEAVGQGAARLAGVEFPDNAGLVANVVRLSSPLPGRAFHEMEKTVVFAKPKELDLLETLKVLPMAVGEEVVGTLVCGVEQRGGLSSDAVRMLGVLAIQAAGSIARGRLFERTERLATTDGLTGLNNHRRFQELFSAGLANASRYGRPLSVLLGDVDHFKSVNDTYGHPIGDKVLRGVADMLAEEAREPDVAARYGGEEFAVILPETDTEGARVIAERIRARIEAHTFQTELGPLKVTISIGVATFPDHGDEKQVLIDRVDRALYAAKHDGRNRVAVASSL